MGFGVEEEDEEHNDDDDGSGEVGEEAAVRPQGEETLNEESEEIIGVQQEGLHPGAEEVSEATKLIAEEKKEKPFGKGT